MSGLSSWLTGEGDKVDLAVPPEQQEGVEKRLKELLDSGLSSEHALSLVGKETSTLVKPAEMPAWLSGSKEPVETASWLTGAEAKPSNGGIKTGLNVAGTDVVDVLRAVPQGIIGGAETAVRAADLPFVLSGESKLAGPIRALESAGKAVGPDKPNVITEGVSQAFQSGTTMLPGAAATAWGSPVGMYAGAISGKGVLFGMAAMQQFLTQLRDISIVKGATDADLAEIQSSNLWKATAYGLLEVGGELTSDVIAGRVFGLLGSKTLSPSVKQGIGEWLKDFAGKYIKAGTAEQVGEHLTGAGQSMIAESAGMPSEYDFWGITGPTAVSSLLYSIAGKFGGDYVKRHREELIRDIAKVTGESEDIVKKEITKAEQTAAGYKPDVNEAALASIQAAKDRTGKKEGERVEKREWKDLQTQLQTLEVEKVKKERTKVVKPEELQAALGKMGGEEGAEAVRGDQGQLLEGRKGAEGVQDVSGKGVQQPTEREAKLAKAKQSAQGQEGVVTATSTPEELKQIAKEEVSKSPEAQRLKEKGKKFAEDLKAAAESSIRTKKNIEKIKASGEKLADIVGEEAPKSAPTIASPLTPVQAEEGASPTADKEITGITIKGEFVGGKQGRQDARELAKQGAPSIQNLSIGPTSPLDKKQTIQQAADKLLKTNAYGRKGIIGKIKTLVDAGVYDRDKIIEVFGSLLTTDVGQKHLTALKSALGQVEEVKTGEPKMEEPVAVTPADTIKMLRRGTEGRNLYRDIKNRIAEKESIADISERYAANFEGYTPQQIRSIIEEIGVQSNILTQTDVNWLHQNEEIVMSGQLFDRLVNIYGDAKTDEEIDAIIQDLIGATKDSGPGRLTEVGRALLEKLEAENASKEAAPAPKPQEKPKTARELKLERIRKLSEEGKTQAVDKELIEERTLEQHPLYMTEDEAIKVAEQLRPIMSKEADVDTILGMFKALINQAYHSGEGAGVYTQQLDNMQRTVRATGKLPGAKPDEAEMAPREKDDLLNGIGELQKLIVRMDNTNLAIDLFPVGWNAVESEKVSDMIHTLFVFSRTRVLSAYEVSEVAKSTKFLDAIIETLYKDRNDLRDILVKLDATIKVPGVYNRDTNTISLNQIRGFGKLDTVFAHELIHAVSARELITNAEFDSRVSEIRMRAIEALPADVSHAVITMINKQDQESPGTILNKMVADGTLDSDSFYLAYGFLNNREFMAMAMTEPKTQKFLLSVKTDSGISLWDKFITFIQKYVFMAGETNTLLHQTVDALLKYGASYKKPNTFMGADIVGPDEFPNFIQRMKNRTHQTNQNNIDLENTPLKASGIHAGANNPSIIIEPRKSDATALGRMFLDPQFVADKHSPIAGEMMYRMITGVDHWHYNFSGDSVENDAIFGDMNKKERIEFTQIMKEIMYGETPTNISAKMQDKRNRMNQLMTAVNNRYRDAQRLLLITDMSKTDQNVLNDMHVNGMDAVEAMKKHNRISDAFNKTAKAQGIKDRMGRTTLTAIEGHIKDLAEIDKWGFQDYITHAMKGNIAITDSKGNILSVARTERQALIRANQIIAENPTVGEIVIKHDHWTREDAPIKLSKKQAGFLQGVVAKAVNKGVKDLEKDAHIYIAKRALGKVTIIKPSYVYTAFTQETRHILPGEEDISDIMGAYLWEMNKKISLDPTIQFVRNNLDKLKGQPQLKKMIERKLDAAKGKYWLENEIVDTALARLGIETSNAASKIASKITGIITPLKLGYRMIAPLINRLDGMGKTWVKTGFPYILQAKKFLRTDEGQEFIKNHAWRLGAKLVEEGGKVRQAGSRFGPTYFFNKMETPNREESYVASYIWAKDKLKYNAEKAAIFATRSVHLQEINYNIAAVPDIFTSPAGRLMFQFKSYLVGQVHFIASLKGANEWAKYLTMQFILGGPKGMLITLKSLPIIGALAALTTAIRGGGDWFDELENWANTAIPRFYRGGFGFFGMDASMPASFAFPEDFSDIAGIFISDLMKIHKDLIKPMTQGQKYLKWDALEAGRDVIPIMKHWTDILLSFGVLTKAGYPGRDGEIWDSKGKMFHKMDFSDFMKMAGGVAPLSHSVVQTSNRLEVATQQKEKAQVASIIEHIVKSRNKFDADTLTTKLANELGSRAITVDTIKQALKSAKVDPNMRRILEARLPAKLRAFEEKRKVNKTLHEYGYDAYPIE